MSASKLLKNSRFWLMLLLLLCIGVYAPVLRNGFAVDDYPAFVENSLVQRGLSGFSEIFTHSFYYGFDQRIEANEYRPVASMFFALQHQIVGTDNPGVMHGISLLLYLVLLVVIYLLVTKLFNERTALFSVFVFALMPIHSEVVANIKSQDDLLFANFLLLSLYLWLKKEQKVYFATSVFCYFLALLSKEAALPALVLFPALDYLKTKKLNVLFLWLLIPVGIYGMLRLNAIVPVKEISPLNNALVFASGYSERYAMGFAFLLRYLWWMIWPAYLSWDYSFNHFELHGWGHWESLAGALVFIALLWVIFRGIKSPDGLSWLAFFFLVSLGLYLHFFVLLEATYADRFAFVPSFALATAMAVSANRWQYARYAVLALGLAWIPTTVNRLPDWQDNQSLFEADIDKVPHSAKANGALAYVLYEKAIAQETVDEAQLERAGEYFRASINGYGNDHQTWYNYGMCNLAMGDYTFAELCFKECLRISPNHSPSYNNLGNIQYLKGEHALAKEYYLLAIQKDNTNAEAWSNLGAEYLMFRLDDSAFYTLQNAVSLDPENENAQYNLGIAKKRMGVK